MQELKYRDEFARLNAYFRNLINEIIILEKEAAVMKEQLPSRSTKAQRIKYDAALDNINQKQTSLTELNKERRKVIDKEIEYMKEQNGKTRTDNSNEVR